MSDFEGIQLPYFIDGLQFGANFGPGHVTYSLPEDVTAQSQEYRQLNFHPGMTPEIAALVADIMDSACQLVDLVKVAARQPPGRISPT